MSAPELEPRSVGSAAPTSARRALARLPGLRVALACLAIAVLLVTGTPAAVGSWATCLLSTCDPTPCSAAPLRVVGPSTVHRRQLVTVTTRGYSCRQAAVSGTEQVVLTGGPALTTYASTAVRVADDGAFTATLRVPVTVNSGAHYVAGWGPTRDHCWQGSCGVFGVRITARP